MSFRKFPIMISRAVPPLIVVAICIAAGCTDSDGALEPQALPAIRTDSALYHVRTSELFYEVAIGLTYVNPLQGTVYIPTCNEPLPPRLEKLVGGQWVDAFVPLHSDCITAPIIAPAGAHYRYTFQVSAGRPDTNGAPDFLVDDVPGTYRLHWRVLRGWTGIPGALGEELPREMSHSNPFELTLGP